MLTINYDNYETWLMLYLDNELTAAEREAVEAFAKANPAVQEELDGLKDTMLQPEMPVAMPGKERLLMPELWNEEALTPQQQQLLLLTDNELPAGEKESLETAISQSPMLQKEWGLLQKTRPGAAKPMEMPGKDKLYRHERTRVIPFGRVLRFAAAAAILGFGWFTISNLTAPENIENGQGQVVISSGDNTNGPVILKNDTAIAPEPVKQAPRQDVMLVAAGTEKKRTGPAPSQRAITTAVLTEKENTGYEVAINDPANNAIDAPVTRNPAERITGITVVEVDGISANDTHPAISTEKVELVAFHPEEKPVTAYEVVNPDELNDNSTISIAGARIPKQKIRNVYRNITRPIARSFERSGQQIAYAK